MALPKYSINYLPRLKVIVLENDYCYLELCDSSNKVMNIFTANNGMELNDIIQEEVNGITSGDIILNISKNKKERLKGVTVAMALTQPLHVSSIGASNNSNLDFELFKLQVKHDNEMQLLKNEIAEAEEEENEFESIDKWLNHPILGKILTPVLENKGEQITEYLAGLIDMSLGVNKKSESVIAGTTAEERVKAQLGVVQYNIVMNALAELLEKDPQGTIEKIKKIFI